MATFQDLQGALDRLNRDFPRPHLPPLKFSAPYVLSSSWPHEEWPNSSRYGVYAFLGPNEQVLYVGKASCRHHLGNRLGHYFKGKVLGHPERLSDRVDGCLAVVTLGFDDVRAFEAPAVEEYLIANVSGLINVCGRRNDDDIEHGA